MRRAPWALSDDRARTWRRRCCPRSSAGSWAGDPSCSRSGRSRFRPNLHARRRTPAIAWDIGGPGARRSGDRRWATEPAFTGLVQPPPTLRDVPARRPGSPVDPGPPHSRVALTLGGSLWIPLDVRLGLLRALTAAAEAEPLVLLLDDVDRLDPASVGRAHLRARPPRGGPDRHGRDQWSGSRPARRGDDGGPPAAGPRTSRAAEIRGWR